MFDFSRQVVLVTGGSGNLGRAMVHAFHAAGAHLVVPDRQPQRLAELFPELAGSGEHYLAGPVDLGQPDDVARLVEATLERFGGIDVLANSVGGYRAGSLPHETALETWDFMFDLNARSAFIVSRAVIPAMLKQGRGKIIHTAARAALGGRPPMWPTAPPRAPWRASSRACPPPISGMASTSTPSCPAS